jgi:hypothetical protein
MSKSTVLHIGAGEKSIPTKHELCCLELLKAGPTGISKLTTLNAYGETALPTTISQLGLQRGLNIHRAPRKHIHRRGGTTYLNQYWIPTRREAWKVAMLIRFLQNERGACVMGVKQLVAFVRQFSK